MNTNHKEVGLTADMWSEQSKKYLELFMESFIEDRGTKEDKLMKDITNKNKDFIIKSIEKEISLFKKLYEKKLIHITTLDSNLKRLDKRIYDIKARFEVRGTFPKSLVDFVHQ